LSPIDGVGVLLGYGKEHGQTYLTNSIRPRPTPESLLLLLRADFGLDIAKSGRMTGGIRMKYARCRKGQPRLVINGSLAFDDGRERGGRGPGEGRTVMLGIGPEAPPDNPIVNFMMSETRIRKDGSQGFRVACQGSQDSTRSATGIRGKSTETKEGIPMIISGGSRPDDKCIITPGAV
ncbi:hypothetical protein NEUTE1DRAFT_34239, partial [Neurospora tetrasperma FGSC 2508]